MGNERISKIEKERNIHDLVSILCIIQYPVSCYPFLLFVVNDDKLKETKFSLKTSFYLRIQL